MQITSPRMALKDVVEAQRTLIDKATCEACNLPGTTGPLLNTMAKLLEQQERLEWMLSGYIHDPEAN